MKVRFISEHDSIEYPGYKIASWETANQGTFYEANDLRKYYEKDGEVLHVLTFYNSGIDALTNKRIGESVSGYEVIFKRNSNSVE